MNSATNLQILSKLEIKPMISPSMRKIHFTYFSSWTLLFQRSLTHALLNLHAYDRQDKQTNKQKQREHKETNKQRNRQNKLTNKLKPRFNGAAQ